MNDNGRLTRIYFKRMKCECITRISFLWPNQEEYHVYLVPFSSSPLFIIHLTTSNTYRIVHLLSDVYDGYACTMSLFLGSILEHVMGALLVRHCIRMT